MKLGLKKSSALFVVPLLILILCLSVVSALQGVKQVDSSNSLQFISQQPESAPNEPAPEPYSFSYSSESDGGLSTHQESGDGSGRVTGFYTIMGADGRERRVDYVADAMGYRAKVSTNEIGTRAESSADAEYDVQQPSAGQLEAAKVSYEQYKYLEETHAAERERQLSRSRPTARITQSQQVSSSIATAAQRGAQFQQQLQQNSASSSGGGFIANQISNSIENSGLTNRVPATGGYDSSSSWKKQQFTSNQSSGTPTTLTALNRFNVGETTVPATTSAKFSAQQEQNSALGYNQVAPTASPLWQQQLRGTATTRRPTTVLQRQMEQQFLLQAAQDRDYPRQQSSVTATFDRQQQKTSGVNQLQALTAQQVDQQQFVSQAPQRAPYVQQQQQQQQQQEASLQTGNQQVEFSGAQVVQEPNNNINEQIEVRPETLNNVQEQTQQAQNQQPIAPPSFMAINLNESSELENTQNNETPTEAPKVQTNFVPIPPVKPQTQVEEINQPQQQQEKVEINNQQVDFVPSQPEQQQQQRQQQQQQAYQQVSQQEVRAPAQTTTAQPTRFQEQKQQSVQQQLNEEVQLEPARPNSVNQIIENINRQEQSVEQQPQRESTATLVDSGRQRTKFTSGIIMRVTAQPQISTSTLASTSTTTTTTTTTPAPLQEIITTSTTTAAPFRVFYQPTTTTSAPTTRRPTISSAAVSGVKGGKSFTGSQNSVASRLTRFNISNIQVVASTTPSPADLDSGFRARPAAQVQLIQQQPTTTRPLIEPNSQVQYSNENSRVVSGANSNVGRLIQQDQNYPRIPTPALVNQATNFKQQTGNQNQQQWKGTKGGSAGGKQQFWRQINTNADPYLAQSQQAPKQSLSTDDYAVTRGFGSRIAIQGTN